MPTFNAQGFVWAGAGIPNTLSPVLISDDDPALSSFFQIDPNEDVTINNVTYSNLRGGIRSLPFTDSSGTSHTENFSIFLTSSNDWIIVLLPGSQFDDGSTLSSFGNWVNAGGALWNDLFCFVKGTHLKTPTDQRRIEDLKIGDEVCTPQGSKKIKWIGRREITAAMMAQNTKLKPIRIQKGALGENLPHKDLCVSRQHRLLLHSRIAQNIFGTKQVLIPAIKLTALPNIAIDEDIKSVEYFHIMLDHHSIVYAEGAPAETLYTSETVLNSLPHEVRIEINTIFPELMTKNIDPEPAHLIPSLNQQKKLIYRHQKNGHPLLEYA